jgi:hypothetical protein
MSDLDPDRFILRQVDPAREGSRTRKDQAFTPLRMMLGTAVVTAALVIL